MQRFSILLFVLCTALSLSAQKDIQLIERQEHGFIIISAKNISKTDHQLTLTVESTGVTLSRPMPYSHFLKAGKTEELVTLTPEKGKAMSYKASVSFTTVSNTFNTESQPISDGSTHSKTAITPETQRERIEGIVLYTKPGCGRCTVARQHLNALSKPFTEIDITQQSSEINALWSGLRNQGLKGNRVTTPVIAKDGIYYHEIPDIRKFLDDLVVDKK